LIFVLPSRLGKNPTTDDFSIVTLANWMIYGAEQWLVRLTDRMQEYLLEKEVTHPISNIPELIRKRSLQPAWLRYCCSRID
jgi:hypothetical protein